MPPSMYPWDGPELYPMCPGFQPSELAGIRRQARDFIAELSGGRQGWRRFF